ncbi:MAG: dTDP-glucose 4,6-dehydratase [candidate division BRC1 bacterium ADurb.BinA292]|nr:MAG: dTDP-glucose 4,6-dehydratase [candidate division BRC1 bacterium ADurb.BinA292]
MQAAVTGAGGFIGSHLTELLLREGWRVRALVHYNALDRHGHLDEVARRGREEGAAWWHAGRLEVVAGDVGDARALREWVRGHGVVFHLAALIGIPYSYRAPQSYVGTNVTGTLHLLEACREEKIERLLHTSTSEVYGSAVRTPIDEAHPLQAQSPYAATKIAADKLVESYARSFDLPALVVRPFNTYGPRQSARAVIPTVLSQVLSGECGEVEIGSPDPVRDWVYAEDTARAFLALARTELPTEPAAVFNVATGRGWTIGEMVERVQAVTGVKKPLRTVEGRRRPAASEVDRLIGDATRLRQLTGWEPEISFETGLERTANWISRHLELYRSGAFTV